MYRCLARQGLSGEKSYREPMPTSERNEQGRFEPEHGKTKEDVFNAMEHFEPYTTGELADTLDIPRRTVFNYLDDLAEEGRIKKKKPEPRRVIWIRGG